MKDVIVDLDKTLIFSENGLLGSEIHDSIKLSDGEKPSERNYISSVSLGILERISLKARISLATARSLKDLSRVDYSRLHLNGYLILENGGIVLEGDLSGSGSNCILSHDAPFLDGLKDFIKSLGYHLDERYDYKTGLVYLLPIDSDRDYLKSIEQIRGMMPIGLNFNRLKRRVLITPQGISKDESLEWLISRHLVEKEYIALGDSMADLNMLRKAKIGISYSDSESYPHLVCMPHVKIVQGFGLMATRKMLEYLDEVI